MSAHDSRSVAENNWGARAVDHILYPIALFATPAFLAVLTVYFVVHAFTRGAGSGVRSFAAVLLPLMVLALLVAFKRNSLRRAEVVQGGSRARKDDVLLLRHGARILDLCRGSRLSGHTVAIVPSMLRRIPGKGSAPWQRGKT